MANASAQAIRYNWNPTVPNYIAEWQIDNVDDHSEDWDRIEAELNDADENDRSDHAELKLIQSGTTDSAPVMRVDGFIDPSMSDFRSRNEIVVVSKEEAKDVRASYKW